MPNLPVLHIGLPKTATTALQEFLFPNHSQVEYLGKIVGGGPQDQFRDETVREIVNQTTREGVFEADLPRCRELFRRHVAPALDRGKVVVWSAEDMTVGARERRTARARNLRHVFGPSKIVLTLRQPLKFVESMYLHKLKEPQVSRNWRFGQAPRYVEMAAWLDQVWHAPERGPLSHLEYAETAELFAEQFGQDNVGIFLFEEFVAAPAEFIARLCRFIGVDGEEGVRAALGKRSNDRWSQLQMDNLKYIAASPWRRNLFRFRSAAAQQRILKGGLSDEALAKTPKAAAIVPDPWRRIIEDHLAPGHARLQECWKLPLEKHGYGVNKSARAAA